MRRSPSEAGRGSAPAPSHGADAGRPSHRGSPEGGALADRERGRRHGRQDHHARRTSAAAPGRTPLSRVLMTPPVSRIPRRAARQGEGPAARLSPRVARAVLAGRVGGVAVGALLAALATRAATLLGVGGLGDDGRRAGPPARTGRRCRRRRGRPPRRGRSPGGPRPYGPSRSRRSASRPTTSPRPVCRRPGGPRRPGPGSRPGTAACSRCSRSPLGDGDGHRLRRGLPGAGLGDDGAQVDRDRDVGAAGGGR